MSMSANNYEVRVLQKGNWTTETRCTESGAAVTLANQFASNRIHDGVKVIEEVYDEDQGIFREKTIFSYYKQDDKVELANKIAKRSAERKTATRSRKVKEPDYEYYDEEPGNRRGLMLVAAVIVVLAGNGALAYFFSDQITEAMSTVSAKLDSGSTNIIYELPAVTTNYRTSAGNRTIQIRVGLEVQNSRQSEMMDEKLSDIVTKVAADLSRMRAKDGSMHLDTTEIKRQLQKAVKEAGHTSVEGVLFKEVHVFR
jgi:flagellar basal body-associated protein FliL